MDRFDAIQAFVRVMETGSLAKVAETLHMSRTSVTQLVQQLEARLRVRLLSHTIRKLDLIADGAAYYERVVHLPAELGDVETSPSSVILAPRGRLRIDVPSPLAWLLLIPASPESHVCYPEIQTDPGVNDRFIDPTDENVDYVICDDELRDQPLMARRVGDLQLGIYAAPAYLQHVGTPGHPRKLKNNHQHIIGFFWARTGRALPCTMHRGGESPRVVGRHMLAMGDDNAHLATGPVGLGILWLPYYVAHEPLARGELLPLFEDWSLEPMPLYLMFPPNRHVSGKLRVFVKWVAELIVRHASLLHPPL